MGRRRNQRQQLSLPVRIFGKDADGNPFARLAHTIDISAAGARISGVYLPLKPGDVIGIQHGAESASFRISWIGKRGSSSAGQIGVAALRPDINIWNHDFPADFHDDYKPSPALLERRHTFRFDCDLGAGFRLSPDAPATLVRCTDISRGGCYLETWSPLPVGTCLLLDIHLPTGSCHASGEVRTMDPAFGMGIRFTKIESTAAFDEFIRELHLRLNPPLSGAPSSLPSQPAPEAGSPAESPAPRILLAEDSRFLRSAYALFLRREGFHVIAADDGDQALRLAINEHPDVIVLDLLMPRLGGVSALRLLKDNPATSSIPVIVLSGLPSSNESKLLGCGAFAYLAKTQIGPEDLPYQVRRAMELSVRPLPRAAQSFGTAPDSVQHVS